MEHVIIKKSILTLDGKNYPVFLYDWAELRLSVDEFAEFSQLINDVSNSLAALQQQNTYILTPLLEEINGIQIEVAMRVSRPIGYKLPMHDDFMYWVERMRNDPCVTTFHFEEPAD